MATVELHTEDGVLLLVLSRVLYAKRYARETRVGFDVDPARRVRPRNRGFGLAALATPPTEATEPVPVGAAVVPWIGIVGRLLLAP